MHRVLSVALMLAAAACVDALPEDDTGAATDQTAGERATTAELTSYT